jgi:hypothetical protein
MKNGIFNINHCLFCFIVSVNTDFIVSVNTDFKVWCKKNKQKEAEIASSAEYLWKDSVYSLVNQKNLTESV